MNTTARINNMALLLTVAAASSVFAIKLPGAHCPSPILSCSSASQSPLNTCCTETIGGLVLFTQFWSTGLESSGQLLPSTPGPSTASGPISATAPGHNAAISPANTIPIRHPTPRPGRRTPSTELWAHEFSKHAICFSTMEQKCFSKRELQRHKDMLDFFKVAVRFFVRLPTYDLLAEKGIIPRDNTGYSLSTIQAALKEKHGGVPFCGVCAGPRRNETEAGRGSDDAGRTVLSEVWFYHHVFGRVQEGRGKAVRAAGNGESVSSCEEAEGAVWYYERAKGSEVDLTTRLSE
ncbi:ribonuclease T2-like protein [Immersiella caudata]|uniref:ribonuclease T2 n=1 Tax=Immersiella caudata TaxID=314043 RepID=A0AA39WC35_9PEZI|nr:ribonuclease T2-like protein [Immersiella caudata]